MQRSVPYTLLFATAVCVVCAVVVSTSAVQLKSRQEENARLDRRLKVLEAAGYVEPGQKLDPEEVERRFAPIESKVVDLATGDYVPDVDPATYDQQKALSDPAMSRPAPPNPAQIQRLPDYAQVYEVYDDSGALQMVILPVEGKGLWSTLYGFLALESDLETVHGLTFYQHGETPGLGGEVDNPRWKARWVGRKLFGEGGEPKIEVIRGAAGSPDDDPYSVDGLSGATLTSRGVTNLVRFWVGENGFDPYLQQLEQRKHERSAA
jgi:Na+-transporting NADH:ubiquinone oxidoreductase subunit C